MDKHSSLLRHFISSKEIKSCEYDTPGAVFTTLYLLLNLRMGPLSLSVTPRWKVLPRRNTLAYYDYKGMKEL